MIAAVLAGIALVWALEWVVRPRVDIDDGAVAATHGFWAAVDGRSQPHEPAWQRQTDIASGPEPW